MGSLFRSIREYIPPQEISKLAVKLNEKEESIQTAVYSIVSSLFEIIMKTGENKKLELIFKAAGTSSILLDISDIFSGNFSSRMKKIDSKFLQNILKNKENDFKIKIASLSRISKASADKTVQIISLLVVGFLGEKIVAGISYFNILEILKEDKNEFHLYVPIEMEEIIERSFVKSFRLQRLWHSFF